MHGGLILSQMAGEVHLEVIHPAAGWRDRGWCGGAGEFKAILGTWVSLDTA